MQIIEINDQSLEEVVKVSNKVVLDCYAPWCGPCKMLSPILGELSEEFEDVDFYKINVDNNEKVCSKYDIMSIPTILLFEDGKLKNKFVGFRTKDDFRELIEK